MQNWKVLPDGCTSLHRCHSHKILDVKKPPSAEELEEWEETTVETFQHVLGRDVTVSASDSWTKVATVMQPQRMPDWTEEKQVPGRPAIAPAQWQRDKGGAFFRSPSCCNAAASQPHPSPLLMSCNT